MDRAGDFVQQQVQLLQSLPSFETLRPDIEDVRAGYEQETDEDGERVHMDLPSEQSIKKALKKANDSVLQKMRSVHTHEGRREVVNQLLSILNPRSDRVDDASASSDWQRLPMEWPSSAKGGTTENAENAGSQADTEGSHPSAASGPTEAGDGSNASRQLREQYKQLRQKLQKNHEELQRLRSRVTHTQDVLKTTQDISKALAGGAVDSIATAIETTKDPREHAMVG